MSSAIPFKTYAVTVRPSDGITDPQIEKFVKWVKRHCVYYHVVTEKDGSQRHIHSGLVLKEPKLKTNVTAMLKGLFKQMSTDEHRVLSRGVKIMYNDDFIQQYLDKDDDTVVIESCLPESGTLESFYPPKPTTPEVPRKCSAYYHELEALWYKHQAPHHDVNTMCVRDFLFKMMYSDRVIPVIRDDKQIIQVARHLVRWIKKADASTIVLPPFESEE